MSKSICKGSAYKTGSIPLNFGFYRRIKNTMEEDPFAIHLQGYNLKQTSF